MSHRTRPAVPASIALAAVFALFTLSAAAASAQMCFDLSTSTKVGVDRNGGSLDPGDLLDWTIVIRNTGFCDAPGVPVFDTLEAKQDFILADKGGVYDPSNRMVTWSPTTTPELASIAPGASVTLKMVTEIPIVSPPVSAPFCNQAFAFQIFRTDDPSTTVTGDATCLGPITGGMPAIAGIDPCRGTKKGGTTVTVTGSGFEAGLTLTIGGVAATVVSVAPDTIVAMTGAHSSVGSVDVVVRNPGGGSATLTDGYVYTPPPFPIQLHGGKKSGQVWLVWTDTGNGPNTVERSTSPSFPCGITKIFVAPPPSFADPDPTLDDGQLWFYRIE